MKKILFLMVFLGLFCVGIANATISTPIMTSPATGGTIAQNGVINITSANTVINWTSCLVQAMSPSTANSSWSTVINLTNTTENDAGLGDLNGTLSSMYVLEDASDYSWRAICYNSSDAEATGSSATSAIVTSVIVDRTTPTAPSSVTFSNPVESGETITATVVGAETTNCYIRFGSQNTPRYVMSLSGNTCTYTVTGDNPPDSSYSAFVEASDGKDNTFSSAQNIEIDAVKSDGGGVLSGAQVTLTGGSSNPLSPRSRLRDLLSNPIVIVVVLAGAGLYFYNKNN